VRISNTADSDELQEDLSKLVQWSSEWQMLFNVDKCNVMHISKKPEWMDVECCTTRERSWSVTF